MYVVRMCWYGKGVVGLRGDLNFFVKESLGFSFCGGGRIGMGFGLSVLYYWIFIGSMDCVF